MTMCTGWFWSGKAVSVRFDQVHGLKDGDRVLFEGKAMGKVTDVDYQKDGRFLVSMGLSGGIRQSIIKAIKRPKKMSWE